MKRAVRILVVMGMVALAAVQGKAQKKYDDERMLRDIEVTENILATVIKQQLDKRTFFPVEINGEYREGYGVTYRLPYQINGPMVWGIGGQVGEFKVLDGRAYNYSFNFDSDNTEMDRALEEELHAKEKSVQAKEKASRAAKAPGMAVRSTNSDSLRNVTTNKIIEACKEFIVSYGDLVTQLKPEEKIMITNRGEGDRFWYGAFVNASRPSYISVEVLKSDLNDFRQGKITRETLDKRIKVVNSVMDDELKPDLELFTSIFNRLYRPDLSKTFFTEQNVYYERMKNYGVIYYMQVYSSNSGSGARREDFRYSMPTIGLEGLTQAERDKKVVELYPKFEKDIKEDLLEYGRTVKSLAPEEMLILNIKMTRCDGCGIPSFLEVSIKADVLTSYAAGKMAKEQALARINVKKGPNQ
jgi:hypothetical protein